MKQDYFSESLSTETSWNVPSPSVNAPYIELKVNRNYFIAFIFSILLHIALLFIKLPEFLPTQANSQNLPMTINVNLAPNKELTQAAPTSTPTEQTPQAIAKAKPKPKVLSSPVITAPNNTFVVPTPPSYTPAREDKAPAPSPPPKIEPGMDMSDYVNAARARRLAAGDAGLQNEAEVAKQQAPSKEEVRSSIIARNLQAQGQNGLFTILSKDERYARISFRGWTNDPSNAKQEIISVDAGENGNIEQAIIRRIIETIRIHYKEDFNWHSRRLDRVIVLSARPEDTAGLEDFLMREMFGKQSGLPLQY